MIPSQHSFAETLYNIQQVRVRVRVNSKMLRFTEQVYPEARINRSSALKKLKVHQVFLLADCNHVPKRDDWNISIPMKSTNQTLFNHRCKGGLDLHLNEMTFRNIQQHNYISINLFFLDKWIIVLYTFCHRAS